MDLDSLELEPFLHFDSYWSQFSNCRLLNLAIHIYKYSELVNLLIEPHDGICSKRILNIYVCDHVLAVEGFNGVISGAS